MASRKRCLLISSWLHFRSNSFLMAWKKQWMMAQGFGPLPPLWDTWMKFLALGFGLDQLWLSGKWVIRWKISLSPLLSVALPNKQKNLEKNIVKYAFLPYNRIITTSHLFKNIKIHPKFIITNIPGYEHYGVLNLTCSKSLRLISYLIARDFKKSPNINQNV